MSGISKIQSTHLERKAIIYIRQSSVYQVEHHTESRKRQYQLKERAINYGWHKQDCLIIDDDLGLSGAASENRQGYQKLISMVVLREVGIVFGIEVSRLTRNCLEMNKANRGELEIPLPIGHERDPEGKIVMSCDQSVRDAIFHLFELFRQIRSIRGTLLYLKRNGLTLPYQKRIPGLGLFCS
jgi:hypothetical protein